MRTLLTSSLALVLSATACTDDSSTPMPIEEEPEQLVPSISIKAPQNLRVVRGQSVLLAVTIDRAGGFTGPVQITATDLPIGVSAEPITIGENETTGTLTLVGTQSIVLATFGTMTIDATAGELTASTPVDLHMTDPAGTPDITFALTGKKNFSFAPTTTESAHSVAVQPDDKIVVGARDGANKGYVLFRLLPNGDLDPDFGTGGKIAIPDGTVSQAIGGVFVRPDGSILFAVRSDVSGIVYAFDSSGTLLAGFGNTGAGATVLAMGTIGQNFPLGKAALAPDGGILVGTDSSDMMVMRLDVNGHPMTSFDGDGIVTVDLGGDEFLAALAFRSDGRIVLAGSSSYAATYHMAVAQLTPDGQLDTSFSTDGKLVIDTGVGNGFDEAAPMADGRLALSGFESGAQRVLVLKPNGDIDTSFSGDGLALPAFAAIGHLLPTADGIYIAGSNLTAKKFQVGKLGMDGAEMSSFGTDGLSSISMGPVENHYLHAMATDSHGRLVAVGFNYAGAELGQIAVTRFWH